MGERERPHFDLGINLRLDVFFLLRGDGYKRHMEREDTITVESQATFRVQAVHLRDKIDLIDMRGSTMGSLRLFLYSMTL